MNIMLCNGTIKDYEKSSLRRHIIINSMQKWIAKTKYGDVRR